MQVKIFFLFHVIQEMQSYINLNLPEMAETIKTHKILRDLDGVDMGKWFHLWENLE